MAALCVALLVLTFAHPAAASEDANNVALRARAATGTLEERLRDMMIKSASQKLTGAEKGDAGDANATASATMCEKCCSPGAGGDDACQLSFKRGPGVCCGFGVHLTSKAFCCPSRANAEVGFAKCYPSVADGGYRCRQPSRGEGRFVEYDRYRPGERDLGEGGVSPFSLFVGCVFTAFLVRGCLARQREQMAQEFAHHQQQQQASHAQRAQRASHAAAMGIPVGPDGQPVGGIPLEARKEAYRMEAIGQQARDGCGRTAVHEDPYPQSNPNYGYPHGAGAGAGAGGYGVGGLAGAGGLGFLGGLIMAGSLGSHRHHGHRDDYDDGWSGGGGDFGGGGGGGGGGGDFAVGRGEEGTSAAAAAAAAVGATLLRITECREGEATNDRAHAR
jgi:hypothetical protein